MTENLRLVGNATLGYTDLDTSDSDVPSGGFRLSASTSQDYAWCTSNGAECDNQSMVLDSGNSTYGTYYNWFAATASTGKYETYPGIATNSICSKGWRLPTGGSEGEFQALYDGYNPNAFIHDSPVNFILSGYRNGDKTYSQGSIGDYWSSTAFNYNNAYILNINGSLIRPALGALKTAGFSVRCIAK